jgi:preprotein translocase subunit SecF
MWKGIKSVPDDLNIDFMGQRFIGYAFTVLMIGLSVFFLATRGLNYGIDFTGGTLVEITSEKTPDLAQLREDLNNLDLGEISIQEFGSPNHLLLRVPAQVGNAEIQSAAINLVKQEIGKEYTDVDYRRVEFVGPQVGEELKLKGLYAVVFSLLGIMGYVWFRFEWQFGVASIVSIAHDVILILGFMSFTGKTFDLTTLAAILMVAGFSINDTVVVFDRIREILRKYRKKLLIDVCNIALNETMSRTIMTGLLTILALVALWIFGGEVIQSFVDALLFGFLVGVYSSIYVAAPLLLHLGVRVAPESEEKPA